MKPRNSELSRGQKSKDIQVNGPNWILLAGGALLSTLSVHLGYKLKQALDNRQQDNTSNGLKGNGRPADRKKPEDRHSHMYPLMQDEDVRFNFASATDPIAEMRHQENARVPADYDGSLSIVTVPPAELNKENGVVWSSSPDRLELPPRPVHHSNCSDSPCVSESGSDIFCKREVIYKLRQQLKRRDDMILEMQGQIGELQNSLNSQLAHTNHLQSQLDVANKEFFDSEREIQRLRKAIADHCVGHVGSTCSFDMQNGHVNGYLDGEKIYEFQEKDERKIEMLQSKIGELKEVLEGKDYLLKSYKEQKGELSLKVKELQQKLHSQLPNILSGCSLICYERYVRVRSVTICSSQIHHS